VSRAPSDGYSGTPLARKLGIKPGHVVQLVGAPTGWFVPDMPDAVRVRRRPPVGGADVVVAFLRSQKDLATRLPSLVDDLAAEASLWLAWPRRAAGHDSDLTDQTVRDAVLPTGLVDVKVAAIGEDWSGLRFVWRRELRAR
jgi:Protein of unknown function (DUF3052)